MNGNAAIIGSSLALETVHTDSCGSCTDAFFEGLGGAIPRSLGCFVIEMVLCGSLASCALLCRCSV